jgi:hypothetical protein
VILFIGLALAGALFLGPRFQEASLNSKASAAVEIAAQTAKAANLYRVQEGVDAVSTGNLKSVLVDTGYMKSIPTSMKLIDSVGVTGSRLPAAAALNDIGSDDVSKAVCEAVER